MFGKRWFPAHSQMYSESFRHPYIVLDIRSQVFLAQTDLKWTSLLNGIRTSNHVVGKGVACRSAREAEYSVREIDIDFIHLHRDVFEAEDDVVRSPNKVYIVGKLERVAYKRSRSIGTPSHSELSRDT
jgi:hypothetical protein